jgi:acetoin utilization deacetylase AcuC-like enzyme
LDLDYHAGNGTDEIFQGCDDVLCRSLHIDTNLEAVTFGKKLTKPLIKNNFFSNFNFFLSLLFVHLKKEK